MCFLYLFYLLQYYNKSGALDILYMFLYIVLQGWKGSSYLLIKLENAL